MNRWKIGDVTVTRVVESEQPWEGTIDRKSTRLNSSHLGISYAVFCLKKKNKTTTTNQITSTMKIRLTNSLSINNSPTISAQISPQLETPMISQHNTSHDHDGQYDNHC